MAQRVSWSEFTLCYAYTLKQMGKIAIWLPLLILSLISFLILLMHYYIFSPVFGALIQSIAGLINSKLAPTLLHYPSQMVTLPYFFSNARVWVNFFIEAVFFGTAIYGFLTAYRGGRPSFGNMTRNAFHQYLKLTLIWIVLSIILYLFNLYIFDFVQKFLGVNLSLSPRRQLFMEVGVRAVTIIFYASFIFVLPSIMFGDETYSGAIKRGFALFFRHPFATLGIILIPYLIGIVPSLITRQSAKIVANFNPEMVLYILIIGLVVDVFVNFILLGTAVKLFLDHHSE